MGNNWKITDTLTKVFADEVPDGQGSIRLSTLHRETVSCVIAYFGAADWGRYWKVSVKAPEKIETRLRRVELVPSAYPCHKEQDDNYLRIVPGMYPDLLRDLDTEDDGADKKYLTKEVPGQWRSLWLDVTVDAELAGGDYAIMIETETEDGEKETLKADLHVVDASLPPQKLLHTEWFHSDCLADYYHVKPFSEEHWKILENFIRLYAARGINTILTPVFTPPLDTAVGGERTTVQLLDIRKDGDTYSFDFSKLERWIGICRFAGITHFEMAHLFTQWGAKCAPKIMVWEDGTLRHKFGWHTDAQSPEYADFLAQYLTALTDFLKEQGLQDKVFFHISDEPGEEILENYKKAREMVLPYIQGFHTIDALSDIGFCEKGLVDLFAPGTNCMEPFLERGMEGLWTYYCTGQWKEVSNRFMAMPSARTRILGVQLYLYKISGFLHWGFNFYNSQYSIKHINPYAVTDAGEAFPSGDAFLVYPGEGGIPEESIRLMLMQQVMQDVRAFELLESLVGRERVCEIIAEGTDEPITFKRYPKEKEWLLALRERVNAEIEKAIAIQ